MAHFRLSEVFRTLGNVAHSDAEVQLARQTSSGLHREERLIIEGYALLRGPAKQRPESVAKFQALRQLDSSNIDSALLLGNAQMLVNDAAGARETLRDLRSRAQPPDIGRIDLFEADMAYRRGEFQVASKAAAHCAAVVRPSGSRLLAAECLLKAGLADQANGDNGQAMTELQQAEEIFSAAGNRKRVADIRNARAGVFLHEGKTREALAEFAGVVEIARDIGSESLECAALNNLGLAYSGLGQFQEAAQAHLRAIEILKSLHDTQNLSFAYVNLATTRMAMGDLQNADQAANQGLAYAREAGGALEGNAQLTLAGIRAWEGHVVEARQICGQALQGFEKAGAKRYAAYAHAMLGEMWFDSGEDGTAATEYGVALTIAQEAREGDLAPLVLSDQARLALAQGRYAVAARLAKQALETVSPGAVDGKDLLWRTYLAVTLAAQGQHSQADEQRQVVAKGMASPIRPDVRIQVLTAEGWLLIGEKKFAKAIGVLEDARKQAAAHMPSARGEAELALAEAHFGLGNRSEAIGVLRTLAARDPETRAGKLAKLRLLHPGPSPIWKPLP
jgi:tetratricopeptide (TPR) repeat protein